MRILLIEDDKALCRVLQPTLQAAGFASDCCHTGADGLHLLKTGYYDACILDRMPAQNWTALRCSKVPGPTAYPSPFLCSLLWGRSVTVWKVWMPVLTIIWQNRLITVNCWPGCVRWSAGRRICMRPPTGLPVAILSWIPPVDFDGAFLHCDAQPPEM